MKTHVITAQDSAELDKWFKDVDDILNKATHNQPMPRGGARPGTGPKPRPPEQLRSVTFTTRCTPAEKLLYDALKTELDVEYQRTKKAL